MVLDFPKVAMVHTGEQMVLNLHVETPCEQKDQIVICGYIMGSDYLMLEEILVKLIISVRCEMINLA
jgi:hypothetical protein